MKKKGQGIQFNWIFVIVAGAIILSFFVMFTFNYIQLQNTKQSIYAAKSFVNVLTYMESSYTGKGLVIGSSGQNAFKLNFYTNLDVKCDGEKSSITVGNEPLSEQMLQDEIVFAPKSMRVNSMDAWIEPWYYPFFVSNFIFLSKPEQKIYIKYDQMTKDIVQNMQINSWEEYNIKIVNSAGEIEPSKDVSVLWISSTPPDMNALKKIKENASSFSLVQVVPNMQSKLYLNGKLIFYEDNNKVEKSFYSEAGIYAALFSGGSSEYDCGVKRAMNRLKRVSDTMAGKIDLLYKLNQNDACRVIYSTMKGMLKDYSNGKGLENVENLINENSKLTGKGCVTVF